MESSWFWEVIDMAYSQMGTIPWGEGRGGGCERGARTHIYPYYGT